MLRNWLRALTLKWISLLYFKIVINFVKLIYKLIMTQKYSIELIEEHDAVNFYSIHLGEEELSWILPAMKRSSIIEARRTKVSPEVRRRVDLSFLIVDRIYSILEEQGLKQKDLANMLGKKESEISKWMRGTHNFTIETISSIEKVLGNPILQVIGVWKTIFVTCNFDFWLNWLLT